MWSDLWLVSDLNHNFCQVIGMTFFVIVQTQKIGDCGRTQPWGERGYLIQGKYDNCMTMNAYAAEGLFAKFEFCSIAPNIIYKVLVNTQKSIILSETIDTDTFAVLFYSTKCPYISLLLAKHLI